MVDSSALIFDRPQIHKRRSKIAGDFKNYDFLFKWAEEQILDRLSLIKRDFERGVHIGGRQSDGFLTQLKDKTAIDSVFTLDPVHCTLVVMGDALHH